MNEEKLKEYSAICAKAGELAIEIRQKQEQIKELQDMAIKVLGVIHESKKDGN